MRKMLLAAVALVVALAASAQEPKFDFKRDTTRLPGFTLPDSVAHLSPWKPDYRTMAPIRTKPTVSMTSVVVIQKENLPSRVTVIDNNTLRVELESLPRRLPRRTYAFVPDAAVMRPGDISTEGPALSGPF